MNILADAMPERGWWPLETSAWIAVASAIVAMLAVAISVWQAKSAKAQAQAAREQVSIAKEQTELQRKIHTDSLQPYVYADILLDPVSKTLVDVHLENTGPTVATDVQVEFDPALKSTLEVERGVAMPDMPARFSSIPPGRRMSWTLDRATAIFDPANSDIPRSYTVRITGVGPFGPMEPLVYVLNLNDFATTAARNSGTLTEVSRNLKDVSNALKLIPKELSKLKRQRDEQA
ncbi:hypothetical protein [Kribbella deserti]|uniref:Uncharacterized protein n=1 Tax=Kribbella deserti TaxID=1926257 RepID=A0ABV6QDZ0_9ACTN